MTLRFLNTFLLCAVLIACSKDNMPVISCDAKTNALEDVKKLISGTYTWAYTIRVGWDGRTVLTPASTGLNYKYVFTKKGNVDYHENDTLRSSDTYTIDYEFKVTTYPSDSATIVIIQDKQSGLRKEFFRPYLCSDSSLFYNPFMSVDVKRYFKRN